MERDQTLVRLGGESLDPVTPRTKTQIRLGGGSFDPGTSTTWSPDQAVRGSLSNLDEAGRGIFRTCDLQDLTPDQAVRQTLRPVILVWL